jgi:hypothetical protein
MFFSPAEENLAFPIHAYAYTYTPIRVLPRNTILTYEHLALLPLPAPTVPQMALVPLALLPP